MNPVVVALILLLTVTAAMALGVGLGYWLFMSILHFMGRQEAAAAVPKLAHGHTSSGGN